MDDEIFEDDEIFHELAETWQEAAEQARKEVEQMEAAWQALFPMTVDRIEYDQRPIYNFGWSRKNVGRFVSIRPVSTVDPEEKTYLGLYLGDFLVDQGVTYDDETRVLTVHRHPLGNPGIYVFDLKRVVFGYESWWSVIQSEDQLRQITDEDIGNIWYVKALRQLSEAEGNDTAVTDEEEPEIPRFWRFRFWLAKYLLRFVSWVTGGEIIEDRS